MNVQIVSHTSLPSESVQRLQEVLGAPKVTLLHYGKGVSKLEQYLYFKENTIPSVEYTEDYVIAYNWLEDGYTVMCRKRIKGQTGAGIIVAKPSDEALPDAKVYTKYISHKREFRVNLFQHTVVNVREKVKMKGTKGDFHIRNIANGYTTAICTEYPKQLIELAEKASKVSSSDFTGVDIGYNELKDMAFVIEVNSGPSIEGSSVGAFVSMIKKQYED